MGIYKPKGGNPKFSNVNRGASFSSRGSKSPSQRRRLVLDAAPAGGGCTAVAQPSELWHLDAGIANSYCDGTALALNGTAAIVAGPGTDANKVFASNVLQTGIHSASNAQNQDYASIANGVIAAASTPFTIEMWVYAELNTGTQDQTIFGTAGALAGPSDGDMVIQRSGNDNWSIYLHNAAGWNLVGAGFNLQNSLWHHIALMRGTDDIPVIYTDGGEIGRAACRERGERWVGGVE